MQIILFGYKSCGKSTLGRGIAKTIGFDFMDTDTLIIEHFNNVINKDKPVIAIKDVYQRLGNQKFRMLEEEIVTSIDTKKNAVIATGGGVITSPKCISALKSKNSLCIYLKIDKNTLVKRMKVTKTRPSFINSDSELQSYLNSRDSSYEKAADLIVDITQGTIPVRINKILKAMDSSHKCIIN